MARGTPSPEANRGVRGSAAMICSPPPTPERNPVTEIVLHHYPASPFSEKVRLMLGWKGIAWHSVVTPTVMPKPELTALTGGYRKAPVLQVGADVYCDSRRIAALLDEMVPQLPLTTPDIAASAAAIERWCDERLFFLAISMALQPAAMPHFAATLPHDEAPRFMVDRIEFMKGSRIELPPLLVGRPELEIGLAKLDAQLGGGSSYLLAEQPSLADFAAYPPLWALMRNPATAPLLDSHASLRSWLERMAKIGHGRFSALDASEAVRMARESEPVGVTRPQALHVVDLALGEPVEIAATDYGMEPVRGTLVHADNDSLALARSDDRAGDVIVHFPRTGFRITKP